MGSLLEVDECVIAIKEEYDIEDGKYKDQFYYVFNMLKKLRDSIK